MLLSCPWDDASLIWSQSRSVPCLRQSCTCLSRQRTSTTRARKYPSPSQQTIWRNTRHGWRNLDQYRPIIHMCYKMVNYFVYQLFKNEKWMMVFCKFNFFNTLYYTDNSKPWLWCNVRLWFDVDMRIALEMTRNEFRMQGLRTTLVHAR